eukprot:Sspe_Gene.15526::Locus_5405_Transcript_1_1_Confidence_1.000_Length_795::g.15526::m.15526
MEKKERAVVTGRKERRSAKTERECMGCIRAGKDHLNTPMMVPTHASPSHIPLSVLSMGSASGAAGGTSQCDHFATAGYLTWSSLHPPYTCRGTKGESHDCTTLKQREEGGEEGKGEG